VHVRICPNPPPPFSCTNVKSSNALVDLVESCTNLVHLRLGNLKYGYNASVRHLRLITNILEVREQLSGAGY
jgi:hypothetical protein